MHFQKQYRQLCNFTDSEYLEYLEKINNLRPWAKKRHTTYLIIIPNELGSYINAPPYIGKHNMRKNKKLQDYDGSGGKRYQEALKKAKGKYRIMLLKCHDSDAAALAHERFLITPEMILSSFFLNAQPGGDIKLDEYECMIKGDRFVRVFKEDVSLAESKGFKIINKPSRSKRNRKEKMHMHRGELTVYINVENKQKYIKDGFSSGLAPKKKKNKNKKKNRNKQGYKRNKAHKNKKNKKSKNKRGKVWVCALMHEGKKNIRKEININDMQEYIDKGYKLDKSLTD